MGSFRRSWVAHELHAMSWNRSGLLYRGADGPIVYATVVRFERDGEPGFARQQPPP